MKLSKTLQALSLATAIAFSPEVHAEEKKSQSTIQQTLDGIKVEIGSASIRAANLSCKAYDAKNDKVIEFFADNIAAFANKALAGMDINGIPVDMNRDGKTTQEDITAFDTEFSKQWETLSKEEKNKKRNNLQRILSQLQGSDKIDAQNIQHAQEMINQEKPPLEAVHLLILAEINSLFSEKEFQMLVCAESAERIFAPATKKPSQSF